MEAPLKFFLKMHVICIYIKPEIAHFLPQLTDIYILLHCKNVNHLFISKWFQNYQGNKFFKLTVGPEAIFQKSLVLSNTLWMHF